MHEDVQVGKEKANDLIEKLDSLGQSQVKALQSISEQIKNMKQYITNLETMFSEGNISIDTYDSSQYNFLTLDDDTSLQDIKVSELMNSEKYNTLHDAHYKYVNTLSAMEPIALYLDPTNMLPAVIRGTEDEQDKEVEDVMETDEYKQLASENKMEMSAAEEEALADWLLNPDVYTNTSIEDLEGESVPACEGPPTHE